MRPGVLCCWVEIEVGMGVPSEVCAIALIVLHRIEGGLSVCLGTVNLHAVYRQWLLPC